MKTRYFAGLLIALLAAAAHASDLKLPQSSEDYHQISKDVEQDSVPGKRGVVERVVVRNASAHAEHKSVNQEAAESISDPNLVATPAVQVGAAHPATNREYKVSVKWADGKHQFFRLDEDPHLRKGDRVALAGGKLVHVMH